VTSVAPTPLPAGFIDTLRGIVGRENVVSDSRELLVYECDAYTLEKRLPGVVVLPNSTDEVARVSGPARRRAFPSSRAARARA
jgi:glycolate oxidase